VGAYVHQYPERLVAVLLSRRLSDKTALSASHGPGIICVGFAISRD